MPQPDGTYERPVVLACPKHNTSHEACRLMPHLSPMAALVCGHREHGEHGLRWTVTPRGWYPDDQANGHDW